MDNADIFGSLSAGKGPYGGKRGQARMEEMKNNIVKEWEEEQRKKQEAAEKQAQKDKDAGDDDTLFEVEGEKSSTKGGLEPKGGDRDNGKEKRRSWRDGLKKLAGR
ncbi:hypothetical protein BU24DRAFT_423243 [Aaosphaeria arxii CBS 175.79]|uniref:Uncharacterized protein n=1 Tax=Aaosphaeria arxii CBS 175.79 TaxID=1450172 RepID=A0A6A5XNA0_9PLEO|nr:uncharacterized protein BU24DRAFT_423243 [Aaosphaeria arxii CBS 175.79]KAF2014220.1 hypothetical protein BU24DRAFT_423243 [Aaosphaeria arxii CBS 175.79]